MAFFVRSHKSPVTCSNRIGDLSSNHDAQEQADLLLRNEGWVKRSQTDTGNELTVDL